MRNLVLLFITINLLGCIRLSETIRYYPDDKLISKEKTEVIYLDSTNLSFKQIVDNINSYNDEYSSKTLDFLDENIRKRIIPFIQDGGLIKERNILFITSDSILKGKGYRKDDLETILEKFYTNNDKDYNYPESSYYNGILLSLNKNSSAKDLKKELINLTKHFDKLKDKLKDSIKLRIFLDYSYQIEVPQPPDN